jgi:hypothetical protein
MNDPGDNFGEGLSHSGGNPPRSDFTPNSISIES